MPQPLYQKIISQIKMEITEGKLRAHDRLPTEYEMAEQYHVSRITVSHAMKELEGQGIVCRIRGKGTFIQDTPGRGTTKENRFKLIPVILPLKMNLVYDILCGAEAELKKSGYYISYHCTYEDPEEERLTVLKLIENKVSGFLIIPCTSQDNLALYSSMLIQKIPFVLLDKTIEALDAPCVLSNNLKGVYDMTSYVIAMGHRHIAFVGERTAMHTSAQERFSGYCKALVHAGIPFNPDYYCGSFYEEFAPAVPFAGHDAELVAAQRLLKHFFSLPHPPTAVVALNDATAYLICHAAQTMGLSVPQQLSVTGFDNLEFPCPMPVSLTTVRQPFGLLGSRAAQLLMAQMIGRSISSHVVRLDCSLVIRDSVKDMRVP